MDIRRGATVTDFSQHHDAVAVAAEGVGVIEGEYLVGCDGGRSLVRKAAGIEFPGWDPTVSNLIAEVEITDEPEWGTRQDAIGIHGLGRVDYEVRDGKVIYKDSGPVRVMVTEAQPGAGGTVQILGEQVEHLEFARCQR